MNLKKISEYEWEIPIEEGMLVSGRIFANKNLLEMNKDNLTFEQIKRVAKLPGIVKHSFAMPDFHQGYGFPIGGVAAFDKKNGVVSPEGVGYDINCGVRVILTDIPEREIQKLKIEIISQVRKKISLTKNDVACEKKHLEKILIGGAMQAIKEGFGKKEDLKYCEENGIIKNANPKDVSQQAKKRGSFQLGTLGSGNHFIEFGKIEKIFDEKIAKKIGLKKGNICVLIHTGSRALGHQVASDYISSIKGNKRGEISYVKINSPEGKKYISAMNCAANFAFYNRQIISYQIRKILEDFFPKNKTKLFYDNCHNIAKFEKHLVNGKQKELLVIRKGAIRSFNEGRKDIPEEYKNILQPATIPGSMGTFSYLVSGTLESGKICFGSSSHGAGRAHSREEATKKFNSEELLKKMNNKKIAVFYSSKNALVEEAPEAYKNISEVIKVLERNKLVKKVARTKPILVIKG